MKTLKLGFVLLSSAIIVSCTGDRQTKDNTQSSEIITSDAGVKTEELEAGKAKSDLSKLHISGSIKTVTESDYRVKMKQGLAEKGELMAKRIITFNEQGNQIIQSNLNPNGTPKENASYTYDDNGKKIEYECNIAEGELSFKSTFVYDPKGNIIEEIAKYSDGSIYYRATFGYDEQGNQIEYTLYNLMGSVIKKISFKYDITNQLVEECLLKPDGSLITKYTYKYDDRGNKIEHAAFNPDDSLKGILTYKYDYNEQGNWVRKTTIKNDKPIEITERAIELY